MTVAGVEEVKVPAGTFRAIRVVTESTDSSGKEFQTITTWYAPGIGPVRIDYANSKTCRLVSFTPGKAAQKK